MALLHPDVAVVLRHAGLRVQEGHADAALGTQAGIVAAAVLYGLPVELVAEPGEQTEQSEKVAEEGGGGGSDVKTGGDGAQLRSDATHSSQHTRGIFFFPRSVSQLLRLSAFRARTCLLLLRCLLMIRRQFMDAGWLKTV